MWSILFGTGLYLLAYPPWSFDALGWIVTGPLFLGLRRMHSRFGIRGPLLGGFFFGYFAALGLVAPWALGAALDYTDGSTGVAGVFVATLPLTASFVPFYYALAFAVGLSVPTRLGSLFTGAEVGGESAVAAPTLPQCFVFATAWVVAEYLRSSVGIGNSWAMLADSTVATEIGANGFRILGGLGLSWWMAATGALLAMAWSRRRSFKGCIAAGMALSLPLGLLIASPALLPADGARGSADDTQAPLLQVGVVQGGSGGASAWSAQGQAGAFSRYISLSRSEALVEADLIVWPENALTFVLNADSARVRQLQALAVELDSALLIGAPRSPGDGEGNSELRISAYFFDRKGSPPRFYDKRKLLPFIEYRPRWMSRLPADDWSGVYRAGTDLNWFELEGWRIGPLLCFESIDPRLVAQWKSAGVELLINLSNDSWFDAGAGPEQHFRTAVARALEARLPMIRASSTGISGFVDAHGNLFSVESRIEAVALYEILRE